jgi:hypothetical protein
MIIIVYHINGEYFKEQNGITEQITYDEYAEYFKE